MYRKSLDLLYASSNKLIDTHRGNVHRPAFVAGRRAVHRIGGRLSVRQVVSRASRLVHRQVVSCQYDNLDTLC